MAKKIECQECGALNSAKSKFCNECGAELAIESKSIKKAEDKSSKEGQKEESAEKSKSKPLIYIIAAIVVIVAVAGAYLAFSYNTPNTVQPSRNNTNSTNFAACTSDNQCPTGDYCTSYGACLASTCGNGVCTTQERQSNSCPIDCGCPNGYILNRYSDTCQAQITISNSTMIDYVDAYLRNNSITGHITSINNTYYGNQSVKEVVVNCQVNATSYPCQIIFYFNESGDEIHTVQTT